MRKQRFIDQGLRFILKDDKDFISNVVLSYYWSFATSAVAMRDILKPGIVMRCKCYIQRNSDWPPSIQMLFYIKSEILLGTSNVTLITTVIY